MKRYLTDLPIKRIIKCEYEDYQSVEWQHTWTKQNEQNLIWPWWQYHMKALCVEDMSSDFQECPCRNLK